MNCMNPERTGSFISNRRKVMGLTQSQLAQQLGVTDKAVSKWERGRSFPDLSLFTPLCAILGVTLNELFAGESIPQEQWQKKTDEILMEAISNWLGKDKWVFEKGSSTAQNLLEINNLSKVYGMDSQKTIAVDDVSFEIPSGSFIGIMGASGCGKTTLLNLIAGIDKPTSGSIILNGQAIIDLSEKEMAKFRRDHLGFVFQEYNLLETLTIYENIALALTVKGTPNIEIRQIIEDLSEKLDIASILDKFPHQVSGGQRQRCACARALSTTPDLILADEPTGALDSHAAGRLLDILCMMQKDYGTTTLMVTHDALSASYCDRILFMRDGQIKASIDRNGQCRQAFFVNILDKMTQITGGKSYVS